MIEIPLGLKHSMESGDCVLFVGAGIGANMRGPDGAPAPNGTTLASELAEHFSIECEGDFSLSKISEVVEIRRGRADLEGFLRRRLANLEPDEHLMWLFSQRWKAIYTTNFDYGIERAYELLKDPPQSPITITMTSDIVSFDSRFQVPIYHLHGALFGPARPSIVITEKDYAHFRERRRMLFEMLKIEFAASSILYIGYSNQDSNWKVVLDELQSEFYPTPMPRSYRVAPSTSLLDKEILKASNIETIEATCETFVGIASTVLREARVDIHRLDQVRATIPSDLANHFEKSPAAVIRLLSSWVYVNQAPFDEQPNVSRFLRGDRANWALVGSHIQFERDVEEEAYDDLLSYAVDSSNRPRVCVLIGPAGYGVSTLLMTLAARLVKEGAPGVFHLRPGHVVLEGDIEFAVSIFPDRPFFFIDNAADYTEVIHTLIHKFRETKCAVMFVLGEHTNEWRQGHGSVQGGEFELEPLSDPEVDRLLDCLAAHSELGVLAELSRDFQVAAVKQKHGKQLLVAMREATEGKSFDAILEEEFRGIQDEMARRFYLAVCCFYQHGAFARDELLAKLMGTTLEEMHRATSGWTEGVVIYDVIDEYRGLYGARARHRTIAEIVWERCADETLKESLLHDSLDCLNLNYGADKDAFESFVRSDKLVDSIGSLENRIRFFEIACQKDPESPYVRQHYARMLWRAGCAELALDKIEDALELNPRIRVLHHTKGLVLAHIALHTEGRELARRRLVQSEACFRRALEMYSRDEYAYHGLAELYFEWAKNAETE